MIGPVADQGEPVDFVCGRFGISLLELFVWLEVGGPTGVMGGDRSVDKVGWFCCVFTSIAISATWFKTFSVSVPPHLCGMILFSSCRRAQFMVVGTPLVPHQRGGVR